MNKLKSTEMTIKETLQKYLQLGQFFDPDYQRDNPVLSQFKKMYPSLSRQQTSELKAILESNSPWADKYFVGDLLYLYKLDWQLLPPMLHCAIELQDPSYNRIFLRPCVRVFGVSKISKLLTEKFVTGSITERIGISNLIYWLRPKKRSEIESIVNAIKEQSQKTNNLVELYHYQLALGESFQAKAIPNNAMELDEAIRGNNELEDLLYNKLLWTKPNLSQ